tara:strand:- start:7 stop:525 length:519 start_codon:yes stop_codon:yes gene_type:complete
MSRFYKNSFLANLVRFMPILLLFISVLNEIDFNTLVFKYFSFNFSYILIFYFSLKKSESLGYGLIFVAGLFNDAITGFPLGVSSLIYLLICGFAAYLRNITLRPNLIKDWMFFLITILVVNSILYTVLTLIFSYQIDYFDKLSNTFFTFFLYLIFSYFFQIYEKLISGISNV